MLIIRYKHFNAKYIASGGKLNDQGKHFNAELIAMRNHRCQQVRTISNVVLDRIH